MFVTELTFHLASGWLKEEAPLNMRAILLNLARSQLPIGWLKDDADWHMHSNELPPALSARALAAAPVVERGASVEVGRCGVRAATARARAVVDVEVRRVVEGVRIRAAGEEGIA